MGEIEVFSSLSVFVRFYPTMKRHQIEAAWREGNYKGNGVLLLRQKILRNEDLPKSDN